MSNEVYINLCMLTSNACYLLVQSLRIDVVYAHCIISKAQESVLGKFYRHLLGFI